MVATAIAVQCCSVFAAGLIANEDASRPTQGQPTTAGALCQSIGPQSSEQTPVDLYKSLTACINKGDYETAVENFGLAGAYGKFDSMRVTDQSAHQVIAVLRQAALMSAIPANRAEFQKLAGATYDDKSRHASLCSRVAASGPPSYFPKYMLLHGLDAVPGSNSSGGGMVPSFDQTLAWRKALSAYLNCE